MNNHANQARVDVYPDGKVVWKAGGRDHSYLFLSGMHFQTISARPTNSLTNFTDGTSIYSVHTQRPIYSVIDGICVVDGSVTVSSWGHLLTLPSDCRPPKTITFSLNNDAAQASVDVYSDGRVVWRAGGDDHGWLLLSGMVFQTTSASPTYLTNFSGAYLASTDTFQRPIYSVIDDICIVDGFILVRSWGHLLTLPPDCRPSKQIGFSLNNDANQARVDVLSDGRVLCGGGGEATAGFRWKWSFRQLLQVLPI